MFFLDLFYVMQIVKNGIYVVTKIGIEISLPIQTIIPENASFFCKRMKENSAIWFNNQNRFSKKLMH